MSQATGDGLSAGEGSGGDEFRRLLAKAKRGDRLCLGKILFKFHDRLLGRVERRLPPDLRRLGWGEDVVAESLEQAARSLADFKTPEGSDDAAAFFHWLCAIAEHRLIDFVRCERADKRPPADKRVAARSGSTSMGPMVTVLKAPGPTPSRRARIDEFEGAVRAAMDRLYPAYREVIELRLTMGLITGQMAARLGRNEPSIRKLLSRAIGALREEIGEPEQYLSRV
jgi:RNA polymerase sigma factor (sigma-70 family)